MTKRILQNLLILPVCIVLTLQATAQKAGLKKIDVPELKTHISVLAADDMEGRATGEKGLDRAAEYLRTEAEKAGLKAIDKDGDYFQNYTLVNKSMDMENSFISVSHNDNPGTPMSYPFYVMNPDTSLLDLSGEVVFAGYGIVSKDDGYDDLEGLDVEGKILLIMNRGPLSEYGDENLLSNRNWKNFRTYQYKMPGLARRKPKAVLIVLDPKSGYQSLEELSSGMARNLTSSRYVKELGLSGNRYMPDVATKLIFIHREAAEEILRPNGKTLAQLQSSIDSALQPISFELPDTKINILASFNILEKPVPNVVGIIEGSDPELKKEVVIYSAHFDHLGIREDGEIYNGADDNASGTAALIELSQAFKAEQANLKRSVMILWVSGEEIGLYGSKFYSEYPLMPLKNTIVDINLDMIGTVRTERDKGMIHGERVSVTGMDTIGLIGGHQSADLREVHRLITKNLGIATDTSLNDPHHPYRYYYRSDHFNFAKNDIPVLFYSSGIHVDYHKVTDNYERINFQKLKKVSDLAFLVGYELATMPERIRVDNPFSEW